MLKKTITYEDLDGNEVTEDFYFNYTTGELADMAMSEEGGLEAKLQSVIASGDNREIMRMFREIVQGSVGRRSDDGRRFLKDPKFANEFMHSEPWSVMLMEMLGDAGKAAEFIKGVVPSKMTANPVVEKRLREMGLGTEVVIPEAIEKPKKLEDLTDEELEAMSSAQLKMLIEKNQGAVPKNVLVYAMRKLTAE